MKIVLIRHPEPLIAPGVCYGRLDLALNPVGLEKASMIAGDPSLADVTRIWTSPSQRCQIVADILSDTLQIVPQVDSRLQEFDFGEWEKKPWDEVPRLALDKWAADPVAFHAPGGETGQALIDRVTAFHRDLVEANEDCAVVSHGGPLKVLTALLRDEPLDLLAPAQPLGSTIEINCR